MIVLKTKQDNEGWKLITNKILKWLNDPSILTEIDDENIDSPSIKTLEVSQYTASELEGMGCEAPRCIVPDVNGGIVFEWDLPNSVFESIHIEHPLPIEYRKFVNNKLTERYFI